MNHSKEKSMKARIHHILVFLALSTLALSLSACGQSATPEPQSSASQVKLADEPFVNEEFGYSISYPDGWEYEGGVYVDFGPDEEDIYLTLKVLLPMESSLQLGGEAATADNVAELVVRQTERQFPVEGWEVGEVEHFTIAGLPSAGFEARRTTADGTPQVRYFIVMFRDGYSMYAISEVAPEEWESFRPVMFQMLNTLAFTQ
jgi:hypothetical protein